MNGPVTVALALSGCAALLLEIAWTRWLGLHLGNFMTATSTVVAVYMLGLGIGSAVSGRVASTLGRVAALRGYALAEAVVAVCAALSPAVLGPGSVPAGWIAQAGESAATRAVLCAVVLLPPTIAMGATLPLLVRALGAGPGLTGRLYAVNTLGAAVGPLVGVHVFAPGLGWSGAVAGAAALGGLAAALGWLTARRLEAQPAPAVHDVPGVSAVPGAAQMWPMALGCGSGFLALLLQVCFARLLILTVTGSSVYGLAAILSATLLGIGLGGTLAGWRPPADRRSALAGLTVAAGVVWVASLLTALGDRVPTMLAPIWVGGHGFGFRAALDLVVAFALAGPAAVAFGYALPAIVEAGGDRSPAAVGRIFALNTLGAVVGSLAAGWVLLPSLGLHTTCMAAAALAATGGLLALWLRDAGLPGRWWWTAAAVFVPLAVPEAGRMEMNLGLWNRPELAGFASREAAARGFIVYQRDSFTGRIAVWREAGGEGILSFLVNGKADGSTGRSDMVTQAGSAHLAALSHPSPRRTLVIGLGSGVSAGSLALHPEVESVDVVEIEPAQRDVARLFREANGDVLANPKVRIHFDDARRFVAVSPDRWDLIASEPSNLFLSGMVNLYTEEFYRSVRGKLNPGGVFLQWVHYYQMDSTAVRGAVATFLAVFPNATWWANEYGDGFLVGHDGDPAVDVSGWARRLAVPAVAADLRRIGFDRPLDLLGLCVWGPEDLRTFSVGGRICTDDDPWLERASARMRWRRDAAVSAYAGMVLVGDVLPLRVTGETGALRERLGRIFLDRRSLARAVAEFRRALFLNPRSTVASAGLREAQAAAAVLRQRFR